MKLKIRKYEHLLIAILGSMTISNYVLQALGLVPVYIQGFLEYNKNHPDLPFDYTQHLLWSRVAVMALLMAVYYWVSLFTIPQMRRTSYRSFFIYPWVLFQILLLSYLLALGVNVASYYARPAWNNYGGFIPFALFGYNEKPLTDWWAGFDRALILFAVYGFYALVREYIVYRIENSGAKSPYRILVVNQICTSLCVFLLLPYLTASLNIIHDDAPYRVYFLFVPAIILVYFSNTYWLFPRYGNAPGISFQLIWRLAISIVLYSIPFVWLSRHTGPTFYVLLVSWIVQLVVVSPITWMLYQQRKDQINELRGAEIALSRSRADLQFLRSQINPHFLFNVLNTIYATALMDGSKRTANAVQMLGDMMRFMLDDNHLDFIPLQKEMSYLQNYIALQKLRIRESDQIEINEKFPVGDCNHEIIPMLLIPFVENAFKHGIDLHKKSWIHIDLSCDDQSIRLRVSNSLHPAEDHDPEKKHSGIGLKNVRERLGIFYENRYQLNHVSTEKEFIAELIIEPKNRPK